MNLKIRERLQKNIAMRYDEFCTQIFAGMLASGLILSCVNCIGAFTKDQLQILFIMTMLFYFFSSVIFLFIERYFNEKAGYLLREFQLGTSLLTIAICLLFLVVVLVIQLVGRIMVTVHGF